MTTAVVHAMMTTQTDSATAELEAWGRRANATGTPVTSGLSLLPHQELPGVGITGIWECTPGSWHVDARPITEVTFVLRGRGRVTDEDGTVHDIGPGDVLVLPAGWSGRWTIVDTLRKFYVVSKD